MPRVGIRSFVDTLQRSGLAPIETLREALARFRDQEGKPLNDAESLANFLIDEQLVTAWQCEKLLLGKHKGFHLGDYLLLGHLGTGGMSTVYLARHTATQSLRAIKVLPRKRVGEKSYLERFRHEAQATQKLNHPSIVKAFEMGQEQETYYYVMEYCEGEDVSEIVKRRGAMEFQLAARIAAQTARALAYAHRSGLIHRDIKPANLLVDSSGNVKLLDLGLAMSAAFDAKTQQLFRERVIGTADYLSPEQGIDSQRVDHRTDLYSLGGTLYFMLAGQPPFPTGSLKERIEQHLHNEPRDIRVERPDCPHELIAICKRLMMKRPADRYRDAQQAFEGLSRWLASRGFGVDEPLTLSLESKVLRRHVAPELGSSTSATGSAAGSGSNVIQVVDIDELEQQAAAESSHLKLAEGESRFGSVVAPPVDESQLVPIPPAPLPTAPIAPLEAVDPLSPHAPLTRSNIAPVATMGPRMGAPTGLPAFITQSEAYVLQRRQQRPRYQPLTDWRLWLATALGVALLAAMILGVFLIAL